MHPLRVDLADYKLNDRVSSIKLGSNTLVTLCRHAKCSGLNEWYNAVELVGPKEFATIHETNNVFSSFILNRAYTPLVEAFSRNFNELGYAGVFSIN